MASRKEGDPPRVAGEEEVIWDPLCQAGGRTTRRSAGRRLVCETQGITLGQDPDGSDDEAERRQAARLRDKASHLEGTLMGLRVVEAAGGLGVYMKPTNSSAFVRENGVKGVPADIPPPLILENQRLREELDRLASTPSALDLGSGSTATQAGNDALRREAESLRVQMELERKLVSFESRCASAEEQLGALQRYLATASVSYQREIVRLRAVVGQLDPTGEALGWNPTQGRR
ncbi:MAG: hypothetical protein WDW38_003842 [Sanguina aurantia]